MLWVASPELAAEHDPYDHEGHALAEKERTGTRLSEEAQWEGNIRWLMGHRRGRDIAAQILKDAKVEIYAFSPNALQMSFNTGHQKLGMDLLKVIKRVALEEYFTMLKEHGET